MELEYFLLILLIFPMLIVCRIIKFSKKRINKFIYKYTGRIINNQPKIRRVSKRFKLMIYRIDKHILKYPYISFSYVLFTILSIWQITFRNSLITVLDYFPLLRYLILVWLLAVFIYWSIQCRSLCKKTNRIWFTTAVALGNLIIYSPTLFIFLPIVSNNPIDFTIVIIAILFCFLPLYYVTISMLDIVENPLLRIFVGYVYGIFIAVYTLILIQIYNIRIECNATIIDLSSYGKIAKIISDGINNLSQGSLKDISPNDDHKAFSRMMQLLIGGYGTLVIAYITKVASSPKDPIHKSQ